MPHVTQRVCTHPGCERFAKANTEGEWLYCKSHMHQYGMWPRDYRPQADKPLRLAGGGRGGTPPLSRQTSRAGGTSAVACSSAAADGYYEDAATAHSRAQSVAPGITGAATAFDLATFTSVVLPPLGEEDEELWVPFMTFPPAPNAPPSDVKLRVLDLTQPSADSGAAFATAPLAASRLMEVKDEASAPAFDPAFFASVLLPPLGEEDEELWVPHMTSPSAPDAPPSDVPLRVLDLSLPPAVCSPGQTREPRRTGPWGSGTRTVADGPSGAALPAAPRRGRSGGHAPPGTAAKETPDPLPAPDCVDGVVAACSDDPLLPRPTSLTTVLSLAAAAAWGSFHETSPSGEFICASGGGGPAAAPLPPDVVVREADAMPLHQVAEPSSNNIAILRYRQEAVQAVSRTFRMRYSQCTARPLACSPSLDGQALPDRTAGMAEPQPQLSQAQPSSRPARSSFIHPPAAMAPPLPPPEGRGDWLADSPLAMPNGEASGKELPQLDPDIQNWLSDSPLGIPSAGWGDWQSLVDRQPGTDVGGGSALAPPSFAGTSRGLQGEEEDVNIGASPRRAGSAQRNLPSILEMWDAQPSPSAPAPICRPSTLDMWDAQPSAPATYSRPPTLEMLDAQPSAPVTNSRPPTIEMQSSRPPSHEMASMQLSR